MERVEDRFLRYVKINTQSKAGCESIPSTPCQWDLANLLVDELRALGVDVPASAFTVEQAERLLLPLVKGGSAVC